MHLTQYKQITLHNSKLEELSLHSENKVTETDNIMNCICKFLYKFQNSCFKITINSKTSDKNSIMTNKLERRKSGSFLTKHP